MESKPERFMRVRVQFIIDCKKKIIQLKINEIDYGQIFHNIPDIIYPIMIGTKGDTCHLTV